MTEAAGEVPIEVPRDWDGTLTPPVVKKRQRRLWDLDALVISLYAKGLTAGEISVHFAEVYGASVSKNTISRITGRCGRAPEDEHPAPRPRLTASPIATYFRPSTGPGRAEVTPQREAAA